jgi:hypothetical protein
VSAGGPSAPPNATFGRVTAKAGLAGITASIMGRGSQAEVITTRETVYVAVRRTGFCLLAASVDRGKTGRRTEAWVGAEARCVVSLAINRTGSRSPSSRMPRPIDLGRASCRS